MSDNAAVTPTTEDLKDVVITGTFKGYPISIVFGDSLHDTKILVNGEMFPFVQKIVIELLAGFPNPKVSLTYIEGLNRNEKF